MNKITVNSKNIIAPVSTDFYGCFFEDINWAGDGGLYAELLQNRSFEDGLVPRGCTFESGKFITENGFSMPFPEPGSIPCWECEGGAAMTLDINDTLNENRRAAAAVQFVNGSKIKNTGYAGIYAKEGESYRGFFFAKSNVPVSLTFCLGGGGVELEIQGNEYKRYDFMITAAKTRTDSLIIEASCEASVKIGFISLMPTDTFNKRENGLRKDLAKRIEALHPAFLRFPGGCIVEGMNKESIMHFKSTIGPVWERPVQYLLWGYNATNGFGFDEFMDFCEDLSCKPLYVVNCGLSCQGRKPYYMTKTELSELCDEILDMLEYALGSADTKMGAQRAANGHKNPYPLKYLEIGNENFGEIYRDNYRYIYERVKEAYPQIEIIANEHREKCKLPCEIVDEHYYSDSDFFAMYSTMYDSYPRDKKIYVGEYAVTRGNRAGDLNTAAGEAAFIIGMERNQQVVKMTSYAPMFVNEAHCWWQPDLIRFNGEESRVIPLYHVLKLFAEKRGDNVIECQTLCSRVNKELYTGIFGENCKMLKGGCLLPNAYTMEDEDEIEFEPTDDGRAGFFSNNSFNQDFEAYCLHFKGETVQVMYWNGYSRVLLTEPVNFTGKIKVKTTLEGFSAEDNKKVILQYTFPKIPSLVACAAATDEKIIVKGVNYSPEPMPLELSADFPLNGKAVYHRVCENGTETKDFELTDCFTPGAMEIFVLEINKLRHFPSNQ